MVSGREPPEPLQWSVLDEDPLDVLDRFVISSAGCVALTHYSATHRHLTCPQHVWEMERQEQILLL